MKVGLPFCRRQARLVIEVEFRTQLHSRSITGVALTRAQICAIERAVLLQLLLARVWLLQELVAVLENRIGGGGRHGNLLEVGGKKRLCLIIIEYTSGFANFC